MPTRGLAGAPWPRESTAQWPCGLSVPTCIPKAPTLRDKSAWRISSVGGFLVGEGRSLSPALRREHFKAPGFTFMPAGVSHLCLRCVHTRHGPDMEGDQPPSALA